MNEGYEAATALAQGKITFAEAMKRVRERKDSGGFSKGLEPGIYLCYLKEAFYNESKSGNPQINIDWVVMEGQYKGDIERQFHRLSGNKVEVAISYMLQEFTAMDVDGYGCETEEDFKGVCEELTSKHPMVKLQAERSKKNPRFINKNVIEGLGKYDGPLEDVPAFDPNDQGIPEEPAETSQLAVGVKVKYMYEKKVQTAAISSINQKEQKVNFLYHQNVPITDILEVIS